MAASGVFGFPLVAINRPLTFLGRTYAPGETIDVSSADPRRLKLLIQQNRVSIVSSSPDDAAVDPAGGDSGGDNPGGYNPGGYNPPRKVNKGR